MYEWKVSGIKVLAISTCILQLWIHADALQHSSEEYHRRRSVLTSTSIASNMRKGSSDWTSSVLLLTRILQAIQLAILRQNMELLKKLFLVNKYQVMKKIRSAKYHYTSAHHFSVFIKEQLSLVSTIFFGTSLYPGKMQSKNSFQSFKYDEYSYAISQWTINLGWFMYQKHMPANIVYGCVLSS